jgi:hypothetical protein
MVPCRNSSVVKTRSGLVRKTEMMGRFKAVEVPFTKGSLMKGRGLEEDLPWRKANSIYLSYQGKRRGKNKLEGTPALITQNDKNFVEIQGDCLNGYDGLNSSRSLHFTRLIPQT